MSDQPKKPAAEVRPFAERIVEELRPYCERIDIAGSLRRGCEFVSDIEIVCVPIVVETKISNGRDLFGERSDVIVENRVDQAVNRLLLTERWEPRLDKNEREAIGSRYKRLLVDGVPLDLFSVLPPASWAVVYAIRTGPAEFSKRLVTQQRKGGYLPNDMRVAGGTVLVDGGAVTGLELLEEREFFELCGLRYIEPEARR